MCIVNPGCLVTIISGCLASRIFEPVEHDVRIHLVVILGLMALAGGQSVRCEILVTR